MQCKSDLFYTGRCFCKAGDRLCPVLCHRSIHCLKFSAIPHKDCATDASSNFSSDETKSGVNTGCIHEHFCEISSIFPKYLGKYARKMRARRYETGSEGKFASRWRAKSPDALCAVLPFKFSVFRHLSGRCVPASGGLAFVLPLRRHG